MERTLGIWRAQGCGSSQGKPNELNGFGMKSSPANLRDGRICGRIGRRSCCSTNKYDDYKAYTIQGRPMYPAVKEHKWRGLGGAEEDHQRHNSTAPPSEVKTIAKPRVAPSSLCHSQITALLSTSNAHFSCTGLHKSVPLRLIPLGIHDLPLV